MQRACSLHCITQPPRHKQEVDRCLGLLAGSPAKQASPARTMLGWRMRHSIAASACSSCSTSCGRMKLSLLHSSAAERLGGAQGGRHVLAARHGGLWNFAAPLCWRGRQRGVQIRAEWWRRPLDHAASRCRPACSLAAGSAGQPHQQPHQQPRPSRAATLSLPTQTQQLTHCQQQLARHQGLVPRRLVHLQVKAAKRAQVWLSRRARSNPRRGGNGLPTAQRTRGQAAACKPPTMPAYAHCPSPSTHPTKGPLPTRRSHCTSSRPADLHPPTEDKLRPLPVHSPAQRRPCR